MRRNLLPIVLPKKMPREFHDGARAGCGQLRTRNIVFGVVFLSAIASTPVRADFNQTNWGGGESAATAADSGDQTGWSLYKNKDSDVSVINSGGDLVVAGAPASVEHTTDSDFAFAFAATTQTTNADFNAGTLSNAVVTNDSVQLAPGQTTGTYESPVIDLGPHLGLKNLIFTPVVPAGTKVTYAGAVNPQFHTIGVRGSNDGITFTQYIEFANGFNLGQLFLNRYVQYKFQLDTNDPAVTPSVQDVTFTYANYAAGTTGVEVVCSTGVSPCDGQVQLATGFNSGVYFSSIIDLGAPRELSTLDFDVTTPAGANANVLIRAGSLDNPITDQGVASWIPWQSVAASGDDISGLGVYRYVQYKVELTRPGGASPTLERVRINYLGDPVANKSAVLTSSNFDSEAADNHVSSVQWTETVPAGTDARFQIAAAASSAALDGATFIGPDGTDGTYWNTSNTPTDGGCFKIVSTVACTAIPGTLNDGASDQWIAYKVTLVSSSGTPVTSPTVSGVDLRYGSGALEDVTIVPATGLTTTEAGGTANFGVVLNVAPTDPVTIHLTVDKPAEVSLSTDSLTFTNANWNTPQTVTATGVDDNVIDGDQAVTISSTVRAGSDAAYLGVNIIDVSLTNTDNDTLTATVAATDPNATEAGPTTGTFTVSLNGPASSALSVNFNLSGTALIGSDYFSVPQSPVIIPAGNDKAVVTITPLDDLIAEGPETVDITLTGGTGYALGAMGRTATLIILDDEPVPLPTVTVTPSSTAANEGGGLTAFFTISRTGQTGAPLTVFYSVAGTATTGVDYTDLGNSIVIPAGQTNVVVSVAPLDDTEDEDAETIILTLDTDPSRYLIGSDGDATVVITDDDNPLPAITVTAGKNAQESNLQSGSITISRTGSTAEPLSVFYTVTGTATRIVDYTALSGTATILAGSSSVTVNIIPRDDPDVEGDETVILTLSSRATYVIGTDAAATITIVDNDVVPAGTTPPNNAEAASTGAFGPLGYLILTLMYLLTARRRGRSFDL